MNKCIFTGRLVAAPQSRNVGDDSSMCTFTLAVDRYYKSKSGERGTDFIRIVCWNKLSGVVERNAGKGDKVLVEGSLQIRPYTDKKTNEQRFIAEIRADNVEFLMSKGQGRKPADDDEYDEGEDSAPVTSGTQQRQATTRAQSAHAAAASAQPENTKKNFGGSVDEGPVDEEEDFDLDSDPF